MPVLRPYLFLSSLETHLFPFLGAISKIPVTFSCRTISLPTQPNQFPVTEQCLKSPGDCEKKWLRGPSGPAGTSRDLDITFFFSMSRVTFLPAFPVSSCPQPTPRQEVGLGGFLWVHIEHLLWAVLGTASCDARQVRPLPQKAQALGGKFSSSIKKKKKIRSAKRRKRGGELAYLEWSELFRLEGQGGLPIGSGI